MLDTHEFGEELKRNGFNFYSGVPCSFLTNIINYAINQDSFIMATNEAEAIAICSGAFIGGRKPVFLCQNSGLMNAISPLTSLNYIFKIPLLGFTSLRGEEGIPDEPQHELTGTITTSLLDLIKIKWEFLAKDSNDANKQLKEAQRQVKNNQSMFFIVKKDTFAKEKLISTGVGSVSNKEKVIKIGDDALPLRMQVLKLINSIKDHHTLILTATGFTGRELYELEDAPNNFYMVGSMGCVSSIGLGLSLARADNDIIAIDGDAALLMRMGSLATNASYGKNNFLHILLDNNCHESTGGQATTSKNVNFIEIASSCGYKNSIYIHNLEELETNLLNWKKTKGVTFMYLKIRPGTKEDLGRPKIKPFEVKERLINFLGS